MVTPTKIPYRRGKPKLSGPSTPPTPVGLTLVSATYTATPSPLVRLVFDRAIDISGFEGDQMEVDDGTFHHTSYFGLGDVTLVNPTTMEVGLTPFTSDTDPGVFLLAAGGLGIIAVDGSGPWAGVGSIELPFS